MKERLINRWGAIPTHNQSPEVAEPSNRPLDPPAAAVAAQRSPVLRGGSDPTASVWGNQFDAPTVKAFPQRIAVIGFVGNHSLGLLPGPARPGAVRNPDGGERFLRERDFRRGRRVQVVSQRKTLAVDHHHPLRPLAPLGFADCVAPFFAGAKLPSRNASLQSIWRRSLSSPRNALQMSSQTPSFSQRCNRRQQVGGEGYCSGKSCHRAPVRSTQRMPSSTRRESAQGRPPRGFFGGRGSSGSIFSHCSLVSNGPDRGIAPPCNHVIREKRKHIQDKMNGMNSLYQVMK